MKQSKKKARRAQQRTDRAESVYSSTEWKAATTMPAPAPRGWENWGKR